MLAGDQFRQVFAFLGIVAVAADLIDAQVGVGAIGQSDRGRTAADFLHGDAVFEVTEAGATIVLLDGDTVQAEGAHLGPEVAREFVGAVDLGRDRRDLVGSEGADRIAQLVRSLAEAEIQGRVVVADGHERLSWGLRRAAVAAGRGPDRLTGLDRTGTIVFKGTLRRHAS